MPLSRKKKETPEELIIKGLGVSPGIVIGPPYILHTAPLQIAERKLNSHKEVEQETERFHQALSITREQLNHQIQDAKTKYGKEYGAILESHFLILEDEEMIRGTLKLVQSSHVNIEAAFSSVMDKFKNNFLKSNNEYLRERATDIEDIKRRVLNNLLGQHKSVTVEEPSILVADSIKPSDIANIDRSKILGFISEGGSTLSHFAIVARSLNIPAIAGIANVTGFIHEDDKILMDGHKGELIINPQESTIEKYIKKSERLIKERADLELIARLPCVTKDEKNVALTANVELPEEVDKALNQGAEGIGLYRTEYMLFSGRELPTEEQQYQQYRRIAERIHPHKVTMRTFDVGGDKIPLEILSSRGYVHEDNPFLGWRAIRIGLECHDFFVPQLRAILRISASFHVEIMLPMIVSVDEVRQTKKIVEQCKKELKQEKIPFNDAIKIGVMVETPAAAMMADELAEEVDFFSIGTNDLVQYTLAADRGNPKVAPLYSCFHPAVLRLIHRTIESAHKHGIPVAMCGEMASNPYAVILLLGMGLDEFSALPPMLPKIKKLIRSIQFNDAKKFAEKILAMNNTADIEKAVADETKKFLSVT